MVKEIQRKKEKIIKVTSRMEYGNQASTAAAAEEYREEDVVEEVK